MSLLMTPQGCQNMCLSDELKTILLLQVLQQVSGSLQALPFSAAVKSDRGAHAQAKLIDKELTFRLVVCASFDVQDVTLRRTLENLALGNAHSNYQMASA